MPSALGVSVETPLNWADLLVVLLLLLYQYNQTGLLRPVNLKRQNAISIFIIHFFISIAILCPEVSE